MFLGVSLKSILKSPPFCGVWAVGVLVVLVVVGGWLVGVGVDFPPQETARMSKDMITRSDNSIAIFFTAKFSLFGHQVC
jgi:hypothetical protein